MMWWVNTRNTWNTRTTNKYFFGMTKRDELVLMFGVLVVFLVAKRVRMYYEVIIVRTYYQLLELHIKHMMWWWWWCWCCFMLLHVALCWWTNCNEIEFKSWLNNIIMIKPSIVMIVLDENEQIKESVRVN